jgi:hypothetical protein
MGGVVERRIGRKSSSLDLVQGDEWWNADELHQLYDRLYLVDPVPLGRE